MTSPALKRYFPIVDWGRQYSQADLSGDMTAAIIVTVVLIPQSLAYALLAGLPAEVGLYASILPLVAYAIFGTSRTLAVGPVAVVSLMTASALGNLEMQSSDDYIAAAAILALISGLMLLGLGAFRLGFLANFLSHPVIAGFITASGLLIALSQARHILGVEARGHTLVEIGSSLLQNITQTHIPTLILGGASIGFLLWVRSGLKPLLIRIGLGDGMAGTIVRTGPIFVVVGTIFVTWHLDLTARGVAIVGHVPGGLPSFAMPAFDRETWASLALSALLISIIGFVESISIAQTLAAKRRQRIEPDQELIGLGTSNIASAISGGYPVTGGFARSVVNFDAGARTPAAGALTAIGIGAAALYLTPLLYFLPQATLAATIIIAVLSLVDFRMLTCTWTYSRTDFAAVATTMALTLLLGVETGVAAGVAVSIILHLYKTSRPHIAEVGQVPNSQHFRNIRRHDVVCDPRVLTLRIDESLYFANARYLEDHICNRVTKDRELRNVILMFSAVNEVDSSALASLKGINAQLSDMGLKLHLSEVKGPVMDRLKTSQFLDDLTGQVFLSQHDAFSTLCAEQDTAPREHVARLTL